jgi:hypothetical protein
MWRVTGKRTLTVSKNGAWLPFTGEMIAKGLQEWFLATVYWENDR